jgi:hypothetical protein
MLTVIWLGVELFGKAGRVLLLAGSDRLSSDLWTAR